VLKTAALEVLNIKRTNKGKDCTYILPR